MHQIGRSVTRREAYRLHLARLVSRSPCVYVQVVAKHFDFPAKAIGISWTPSQCIAVSSVSTHTYRRTLHRHHLRAVCSPNQSNDPCGMVTAQRAGTRLSGIGISQGYEATNVHLHSKAAHLQEMD
jgi:hypothetical protein